MDDHPVDPLDQFPGQFLTARQAANILKVPITTVDGWCADGRIASRRLGGRYRIPKWVIRNMLRVRMPPVVPNKPFLTLAEAASILHINARSLRDRCRRGTIPCRRVGSRYEISYRTLEMLREEYEERQYILDFRSRFR